MINLKFSDLPAASLTQYQKFTDPLSQGLARTALNLEYVSSQHNPAYQSNRGLFLNEGPSLQVRTILDSAEFDPTCYLVVTHDLARKDGKLQITSGVETAGSAPSCAKLFSLKPQLEKLVAKAQPSPQAAEAFLNSLPTDFRLLEGAATVVGHHGETGKPSQNQATEGVPSHASQESRHSQRVGCDSSNVPLIAALIALVGQAWIGPKRRIHEDMHYRIYGRRKKWDSMPLAKILKHDFFKVPHLRPMNLPLELKAKEEIVSSLLNGDNTLFLAGPAESWKTSLIDKLALDRKNTEKKLIHLNINLLFEGLDREKEFETGLKPARCVLEKDPMVRLVVAIPDLDPEDDKDEIKFYRKIIRELPGLVVEATTETCDLLIQRVRRAVRVDMTDTASQPPKSPSPNRLSLVSDQNSASGK